MAQQLTPALLQAFFNQLDLRYQAGYQRRKVFWPEFAELAPSGTESNIYSWLAEQPGMREWIGPRLVRNIAARAYSLTNKNWEHTFGVDRNKIEDDQAGIYAKQAELQGDVAARWPDDIVTAQLIAGTTNLCYDGQFFFDTDHPVDLDDSSQGTYSNYFTGTALTAANYNTVYSAMQSYLGESGKPLEVQPTVLMTGPAKRQAAMQILQGQLIAQAQTNQAGSENVGASAPTNVFQGDVRLIINPRLVGDTAGAWYLISTDRIKPMIFQQRKAPERTQIIDPTNPLVFNQREWQFGIDARGAAGYGLPFLIAKAVP